jgi:hypothetical protein
MPCSRCKIPTTDQATGVAGSPRFHADGTQDADAEPTRTLKTYRTGRALKLPNPKVTGPARAPRGGLELL